MVGCSASQPRPAIDVVRDREADPARRVRAVDQVDISNATARRALYEIVYSDREPAQVRLRASGRLAEHDAGEWARIYARRLPEIDDWDVLRDMLKAGAVTAAREGTGGVIRSWARTSTLYGDNDRPERAYVERVHGQAAEEVLFDAFVGLSGETFAEQAAAWTVMSRILSPPALRAMLSVAPATPLVRDLQATAAVLDVLPRDREGVLWLTHLRTLQGGAWWRRASDAAARLTPTQQRGLELRHLGPLLYAEEGERAPDREALVRRVRSDIAGEVHVRSEYGPTGGPASESLEAAADQLAWGDLLAITLVQRALRDRELVAELFRQADADHRDDTTEHGGVLRFDSAAGFVASSFPSLARQHDNVFYSPPELIVAMYDGVAHYHFHAQTHRGAAVAGPAAGDLLFADRLRCTALVFTFVEPDTLAVDAYFPGRVVVDLGTITRP